MSSLTTDDLFDQDSSNLVGTSISNNTSTKITNESHKIPSENSTTNLTTTMANNYHLRNFSLDHQPSNYMETNSSNHIPFIEVNQLSNSDNNISKGGEHQTINNNHTLNPTESTQNNSKREVFRYQTEWLISTLAWSNKPNESFLLALSSFIDEYSNRIELVKLNRDHYNENITKVTSFEHPYPATKILWIPESSENIGKLPQLLATTADYLRIWRLVGDGSQALHDYRSNRNLSTSPPLSTYNCNNNINNNSSEVKLEALLNPNQGSKQCAPLTSFDWNEIDPSIIVTASVDTCCAVWDLEVSKLIGQTQSNAQLNTSTGSSINTTATLSTSSSSSSTNESNVLTTNLRTQIVAHNHEVYDVSFSRAGTGKSVFVSAGGDGSVRLFDLRRLSTSSMLFEYDRNVPSECKAIVRVACNKKDPNLLTAFSANSKHIILLDARRPGIPVGMLKSHLNDVNSMSWAPHSANHLCSGSNDQQALIWDLSRFPEPIDEPLLAYRANGKINAVNWSNVHSDWIAIGYQNYLELLRV